MNKETLRALLSAIESLHNRRENLHRAQRMFARNRVNFDNGEYSRAHSDIVAAKMELTEIIRRKLDINDMLTDEQALDMAKAILDKPTE